MRGVLLASFALAVLSSAGLAGAATIRLQPCEVPGVPGKVQCGQLAVPENWNTPPARKGARSTPGRRIELYIVVLPAEQRDRWRPALYDLAGGPGVAATGAAPYYATEGRIHRRHRDVVLVDQRGTGRSNPLRCPALEAIDPFTGMYPPEAVRRCREELQRFADLSRYTTRDAVRDLDAVRAGLGHARIDIAALSYGTRLAQEYARRFPNRVHAMALFGTVADGAKLPLWHARNAQSVADRLVARCLADSTCSSAYPGLPAAWATAQAQLRGKPRAEAFRNVLAGAREHALVPGLIAQFARGNERPLRELSRPTGGFIAAGLYLSVTCAEDTMHILPAERAAATAGTFLGTYRIDEQTAACRLWRVPRVPPGPGARPRSRVPVLFLAGELDHVTPVEWAHRAAREFPVSRVVEVKALGHIPEGLEGMECADELLARFFERPRPAALDVSCLGRLRPPAFKLPG